MVSALTPELIRLWDSRAREGFTYEPDPPGDPWRSHADEVLAGTPWSDDCDGLVSTVVDLLFRAGVPLDRLYRIEVDSTQCGSADHLIGAVRDDAGDFWVIGDTFDPAYLARDCPHRPVSYQRMDDIMDPRPGAPWA